jgi:hypothetical protein
MLEYTAISLTGGSFNVGDTITGAGSEAEAIITNVQASAQRIYYKITSGGPFTAGESISNGLGVSATIAAGGVTGQKGFILVATGFNTEPRPGGSIEFTTGDTGTYVIQSVSGWTNNSSVVTLVLAGEKSTASVDGTAVKIRYDYSNIRLTGHDFLSIGTGGVATTNYPGIPVQNSSQGNEVVELFPARVYYVSTDQDGNFRVGEYFKVDQATGRATLNASAFDLSGLTSLKLGSIGAQLGEQINEFSADATLSGNSNLAVPTEQAVKTYFTQVSSNIVPSVTDVYTLGTSSVLYNKIYVNNLIGPANLIIDPAAEGDNTGTVVIKGNLQVDGTTTTINSTTLTIDDKNIELASVASPTDITADGAGITVKGTTDKTLNWVDATDAWTSSEDFNLLSGKQYEINGTSVLSATTLGSGVTGSSLTSVGTLTGGLNISTGQTYKINNTNVLSATALGSGVTGSSLTSVGTLTSLSSGAITTTGTLAVNANGGVTTNQTTFPLINATATTVNFAGAATALNVGATTGTTTVNHQLKVGTNLTIDSRITASLANTTQTSVDSVSATTVKSIKYLVEALHSGQYHVSEILVVNNGSIANAVEYGIVHTSANPLVSFDADISAGNVRLLATAATATTTLKIVRMSIV